MVEQLPNEVQRLVHLAEQFLQDEIYPREAQLPASEDVPESIRQAVIAASREAGFFCKTQPVE